MATPIMESIGGEMLAKLTAAVPFPKRLGDPVEFAAAAEFLLWNGYVNGEVLRLDGGSRRSHRSQFGISAAQWFSTVPFIARSTLIRPKKRWRSCSHVNPMPP